MAAPALVWFRNDLRTEDHAALAAAAAHGSVLPVFVLDEAAAGAWAPGGASRWWLHHSLTALTGALARLGAPLILRRGPAETHLAEIAVTAGAAEVHAGEMPEPWARSQEKRVARALREAGVRLVRHRTAMLFDQDRLTTKSAAPFQVYSAFARACHG